MLPTTSKRRVVVTGLGALTPLGHDLATTWEGILACKSGIRQLDDAFSEQIRSKIAGRVWDFRPDDYVSKKDQRKYDPFILYGACAAAHAIADSGLEVTDENADRIATAIGAGIGGLATIEANHNVAMQDTPKRVSPFFITGSIINMVSGLVSITHGLRGPSISAVSACSTATHNIGLAARMIMYGEADAAVAGGAEYASTVLGMSGFSSIRALSSRNDDPEAASRPWDKNRDGFVLSDGAGVLVLEEYEAAKKRGANIYAELSGFGMSSDAFHITLPDETGGGASRAMSIALKDAGLSADKVDYINAHATSTPAGDRLEVCAIKKTFGDHADALAVSSTKSMTGHLLGAAGAVEAIFTLLAMRDQVAPATKNLVEPSEGCDLDFIPGDARPMKIDHALSNSFGFGGTNACLLFSKV